MGMMRDIILRGVQAQFVIDDAPAASPIPGRFDRTIDALNRLPRPMIALGTIAVFGFAMVAPQAFSARMMALRTMPEPLWWFLAGVCGTHFGAREAFHARQKTAASPPH